jgi:hypothetical protein
MEYFDLLSPSLIRDANDRQRTECGVKQEIYMLPVLEKCGYDP